MVSGADDGEGAVDGQESGGRTAAERLAALEAVVEAMANVVGPDGVVRAQRLSVGQPTGAVVTLQAVGGYATVELQLPTDTGADNKVVLFAGRGDGSAVGGDRRPRLGAAVFGDGSCRAGVEITQDDGGGWSTRSLGGEP